MRYVVAEVKRKGSMVELRLARETDPDYVLTLEIEYSWRREGNEYEPVFESAFLSHPGTHNVVYTGMGESAVDELVNDWSQYVSKT